MPPERRPTRRDFLKNSTIALGGGLAFIAAGEGLDRHRAREHTRDSKLEALFFDAHKIKIDYPEKAQERTPQIQVLITAVASLQEIIVASLQDMDTPPDALDQTKRQWWQKLKTIFPDIPDYNEDEYTHFILEDLPKRLADYGIFVKTLVVPILNRDYDTIAAIEPIVGLYEIVRHTSSMQQPEGTPLTVDRIDVRRLVPEQLNGTLNTMLPMLPPGQTFYQNIIINSDPTWRQELEQDARNTKASYGRNDLGSFSDGEIDALAQDNRGVSVADLALLKIIKRMVESDTVISGWDQRVMDHEAGHVAYHQSSYMREMRPIVTRSATEAIQQKMNWSVHDEIVANIGELRGADNKLPSLHYILNLLNQEAIDVQHPLSARWVVQAMVEEIVTHPEDFGIAQAVRSDPDLERRIILTLPELSDRPEVFNNLMDAVKSRYESEFRQLDFGAEGAAVKFERSSWDDRLAGKKGKVAGRDLIGMAVAAGLNALVKRVFKKEPGNDDRKV